MLPAEYVKGTNSITEILSDLPIVQGPYLFSSAAGGTRQPLPPTEPSYSVDLCSVLLLE